MFTNSLNSQSKPLVTKTIINLDKWLLSNQVCNTNGAIAGVIESNKVSYWYNEIAGYYLTYLAHLNSENKSNKLLLNNLSYKVSDWLFQQWRNKSWLTRQHIKPTLDWRNYSFFSFDIAMVLRGLADAKSQSLSLAWDGMELAEYMKCFIDKGSTFQAIIKLKENVVIKESWSTNIGAYQWKTLSGLIRYSKQFNSEILNQEIQCLTNQLKQISKIAEVWNLPPHPTLYAIEGIKDCCNLMINNTPEIEINYCNYVKKYDINYWRIDVIAQLLRLMVDKNYPLNQTTELADCLINSVSKNGSIGFKPYNHDIENVWCALFTRQALSNYKQYRIKTDSSLSEFI